MGEGDLVDGSVWPFVRNDGALLSSDLTLDPEGEISGYSNYNESSWRVRGCHLEFLSASNEVTSRFNRSIQANKLVGQPRFGW